MSDRLTRQGQSHARAVSRKYTDRCTVRKVSKVKGADMGNRNSEQILATNVPCMITAASAEEKQVAGATEGSAAYKVRIPYWQGESPIKVDSTCFFDIAARGEVEAHTLSVVAPLPGSTARIDAVAIRTA